MPRNSSNQRVGASWPRRRRSTDRCGCRSRESPLRSLREARQRLERRRDSAIVDACPFTKLERGRGVVQSERDDRHDGSQDPSGETPRAARLDRRRPDCLNSCMKYSGERIVPTMIDAAYKLFREPPMTATPLHDSIEAAVGREPRSRSGNWGSHSGCDSRRRARRMRRYRSADRGDRRAIVPQAQKPPPSIPATRRPLRPPEPAYQGRALQIAGRRNCQPAQRLAVLSRKLSGGRPRDGGRGVAARAHEARGVRARRREGYRGGTLVERGGFVERRGPTGAGLPADTNRRHRRGGGTPRDDCGDGVRPAGSGIHRAAELLSTEKDEESAIAVMKRLVLGHEDNAAAQLALARLLARTGNRRRRCRLSTTHTSSRPTTPRPRSLRARLRHRANDVDGAFAVLAEFSSAFRIPARFAWLMRACSSTPGATTRRAPSSSAW